MSRLRQPQGLHKGFARLTAPMGQCEAEQRVSEVGVPPPTSSWRKRLGMVILKPGLEIFHAEPRHGFEGGS